MELIEHIEVGSGGAASIEFSSIPATYTDLYLVLSTRQESATNATVFVNPNGLTTNQSFQYLEGNGSVATSSTETRIKPLDNPSGATANTFANTSIYIPNYAGSNYKSFSIDSLTENNSTTAYQRIAAALWSVTDAIASLEIIESTGDIAQYSSATLYGIRKYDTAGSPKATGGIISFDSLNNNWVHTFTASGTFTPTENLTAEYLVIAGGGSGLSDTAAGVASGGGGAGGYRSSVSGELSGGGASAESPLSLTASTGYTVTVGAGGSSAGSGANGVNSTFATITSDGGGRGGGYTGSYQAAASGGSGGGGAYNTQTGGAPTTNQGYAGGNATSGAESGAGGGGAGAVGVSITSNAAGGAGGTGVASSITGSSIIRAGGGGGGADQTSSTPGTGGAGGGGIGGTYSPATNGSAGVPGSGSGGGGGGGNYPSSGVSQGGNGGSGIVIVRYSA